MSKLKTMLYIIIMPMIIISINLIGYVRTDIVEVEIEERIIEDHNTVYVIDKEGSRYTVQYDGKLSNDSKETIYRPFLKRAIISFPRNRKWIKDEKIEICFHKATSIPIQRNRR